MPASRPTAALVAVAAALVLALGACAAPTADGRGDAASSPAASDANRTTEPTTAPTDEPPTPTTVPAESGPLATGSSARAVDVGGTVRSFRAYRPADLPDPAPLVVVLHGWTGSAAGAEETFGWDAVADREGFVVVYPDGVDQSFNAGECCGTAPGAGVDDVAATLAMVDDVAGRVPVDEDRVYAAGFSNGGAMTYRLACETDRFAAFGPVGGGLVTACADREPTSVLHVHGTDDRVVPVTGGGLMGHPPVAQVLQGWAAEQGCAPAVTQDAGRVHRWTASCPEGREIGLVTVDKLEHLWSAHDSVLSTTETLWDFFSRHHR